MPESDSHYSMMYLHTQSTRVARPQKHQIPPRIQAQIEKEYAWYYQYFYSKPGATPSACPLV